MSIHICTFALILCLLNLRTESVAHFCFAGKQDGKQDG